MRPSLGTKQLGCVAELPLPSNESGPLTLVGLERGTVLCIGVHLGLRG